MGTGQGLACQEAAGRVSGLVWNQTDQLLESEHCPLADYPDLLVTLLGGSTGATSANYMIGVTVCTWWQTPWRLRNQFQLSK